MTERSTGGLVDSPQVIHAFLAAVKRRLELRSAARALLVVAVVLAGAGLLWPLWAARAAPENVAHLARLGWTGVLACLAAGAAAGLIRPRLMWRRDARVARYVGDRHPALASDLLSAVELDDAQRLEPPATAHRFSPVLVDAFLAQAAARIRELDASSLVPIGPLRWPAVALVVAVAAHVAMVAVSPDALRRGWNRLLAGASSPPAGDFEVSAEPLVGDLQITLVYPEHSGRGQLVLPSASGDIQALPGTRVTLRTSALLPVTAARILFRTPAESDRAPNSGAASAAAPSGDGKELAVQVRERTLTGSFEVREPAQYRFLIETPTGDRHLEGVLRDIDLEVDEPPSVELFAPADELDVTRLKRVELAYTAADDYGISRVELVTEGSGPARRITLPVDSGRRRVQHKWLWDLAETSLPPGSRLAYWLEVSDNDAVLGPNQSKSRVYYLRVFSPREQHEALLDRQEALFEKMLATLGGWLVIPEAGAEVRTALNRQVEEIAAELGSLVAALEEDDLAAVELIKTLRTMRRGLQRRWRQVARLVTGLAEHSPGATAKRGGGAGLAAADKRMVAELERDVLALADWIDRQRMENVLAVADEVQTHQDRLVELFKEYARTRSPDVRREIERELRALEQRLAELESKRGRLAADVLDRFVNEEAVADRAAGSCIDDVRRLLAAGDAAGAQKKMEQCSQTLDHAAAAMERALSSLRRDKFSQQQSELDKLLDALADLARDQRDIAESADEMWNRYAERADAHMRDTATSLGKSVAELIAKLRAHLDEIPADGLTPFSREERDVVRRRIGDVEQMLAGGDIAEATAMAKQAEASLQTMAAELESALEEEEDPAWRRRTALAVMKVNEAASLATELVRQLEAATPPPQQIMSPEDRERLGALQGRQNALRSRARRLTDQSRRRAATLPGESGPQVAQRVGEAIEQMRRAAERMRAADPSGARHEARAAADTLERAQEDTRGAARFRQPTSGAAVSDEPIRIPGAEQYRAPPEFREDLLEAMKKEKPPRRFRDQVRRYYEELIR